MPNSPHWVRRAKGSRFLRSSAPRIDPRQPRSQIVRIPTPSAMIAYMYGSCQETNSPSHTLSEPAKAVEKSRNSLVSLSNAPWGSLFAGALRPRFTS